MAIEIEVIINPSDRPMPEGFDSSGNAWSCAIRRNGATEMRTHYFTGSALGAPTALDVLDSLRMDASTIYQSWNDGPDTFESWAAELGYDSDSRKAGRTYNLVKSEADRVRAFIGNDSDFAAFLDSNPDDPACTAWEATTDAWRVIFHPERVGQSEPEPERMTVGDFVNGLIAGGGTNIE